MNSPQKKSDLGQNLPLKTCLFFIEKTSLFPLLDHP